MNQNEQGMLYPFRLSGVQLRRSAAQLHRQGRTVDALTLVRRAAEQDDTPSAWQALAEEYRRSGNWEAAVYILSRVLGMDPHQPGVWVDLAACLHALGMLPLAADCAYHQLREDPWSADGDAARALLDALNGDVPEDGREPHRTQRLIHRAVRAWSAGDRPLGERRLRRAMRLTHTPQSLGLTAAMLCMLASDERGALTYLTRSLHQRPDDAQTLIALAMLYHQMGKPRMARGFLRRAAALAETPMEERRFLTAAWALDAWPEMEAFLDVHAKRWPYRTSLMSARAVLCGECDDLPGAQTLWRDILAIDPEDRWAEAMLEWTRQQPEAARCVPGMLPAPEKTRQLEELEQLTARQDTKTLLQCGGRARQLIDWMLASSDAAEAQQCMFLLEARLPDAGMIPLLKELLCRPDVPENVRQWALVLLAEGGETELLILSGGRYSLIQCRPLSEKKRQQPWRCFLPLLLTETRKHCQNVEIADYAAGCWRCMSAGQRAQAAGTERYAWCKAMEILYLREIGQDALAARVAQDAPLSNRRISRVMRQLLRCMQENDTKQ